MSGNQITRPNHFELLPTTELTSPVSAAELAQYLGLIVDLSEPVPDAEMLDGLLLTATQAVIDASGVQIVERDFVYTADFYPSRRAGFGGLGGLPQLGAWWLELPVWPVADVELVVVADDHLDVGVDYERRGNRLLFSTYRDGRVVVGLTAGAATPFGAAAVLATAAYLYEQRGSCDAGDAVRQSGAWGIVKGRRRIAGGL